MSVSGADSGERDVTGAHQMSLLHHHHVTTCQHIHVSWIMSCFLSADTWVNIRYDRIFVSMVTLLVYAKL